MYFEEFKLELNWIQLTFYSKAISCHLTCISTFGWDARRSDASFRSLSFKRRIMFSFQCDHHWVVITSEVLSKEETLVTSSVCVAPVGTFRKLPPVALRGGTNWERLPLNRSWTRVSEFVPPPFCTSKSFQCFISVAPLLVPRRAFSAPPFSSFAFQKTPPS